MKTALPLLASLASLLLNSPASALDVGAEGPVSTGHVLSVDPEAGTMTLYSDQTRRPIRYRGMTRARVETSAGRPVGFAQVQPEMSATVYYALRGQQWYVGKLVIAESPKAPAIAELTRAQRRALASKAARDNDITTQPGSKARLDNDITTQPGKKDALDNDITRQPGNR